ncbi:hypothetical protein D0Q02_30855 [Micromonospora craniellae]|uniref:Uncharacterized protein n=1 Tax=Micromonospora craniellae TaxID=2294034 RepID=A0A372FQ65_9ACTN|nr:hypothetical protein D0Q02_30855 [Micromonospora craniellae]
MCAPQLVTAGERRRATVAAGDGRPGRPGDVRSVCDPLVAVPALITPGASCGTLTAAAERR